jgi:hypothetical protein
VCLNWIRRPRGLAPIGYGLSGTTVFFPISPNLAVLGEFGGQTDDVAADAFAVADFNRRVVNNANRQVFAKDDNFQLFDGRDFFGAADLLKRAQEKNAASSHNQVKQHDA